MTGGILAQYDSLVQGKGVIVEPKQPQLSYEDLIDQVTSADEPVSKAWVLGPLAAPRGSWRPGVSKAHPRGSEVWGQRSPQGAKVPAGLILNSLSLVMKILYRLFNFSLKFPIPPDLLRIGPIGWF